MSYGLGVDVGTSFTAAAVCRTTDGRRGEPELVGLGSRSAAMPSLLFVGTDGRLLVGDGAERRLFTEPDRVAREFKRRIGDDVPVVVGERGYAPEDLAATLVAAVVQRAAEREGGPAECLVLTHPASWGPHKKGLFVDALERVGVTGAVLLPEPEAAAVSYAAQARVEPGATIAVYDLGGGTFDAAVVRKTGERSFDLLGCPEGLEHLGGIDFDEAVFDHVRAALGAGLAAVDPADPDALAALARLRRDCVEAKEALSADTEVAIPVLLPGLHTQVRLVRAEFEAMIRPAVEETVEALRRAIASAGLGPDDLDAVLLVGGSSRVPLVAQLVSAELGRPVAIDTDPKGAIATGAALTAAVVTEAVGAADGAGAVAGDADDAVVVVDPPAAAAAPERPASAVAALQVPADPAAEKRRRRLKTYAAAGLLALALSGAAAVVPMTLAETANSEPSTADGTVPRGDVKLPASLPPSTTPPPATTEAEETTEPEEETTEAEETTDDPAPTTTTTAPPPPPAPTTTQPPPPPVTTAPTTTTTVRPAPVDPLPTDPGSGTADPGTGTGDPDDDGIDTIGGGDEFEEPA